MEKEGIRAQTSSTANASSARFTDQISAALGRRVTPGQAGRPRELPDVVTVSSDFLIPAGLSPRFPETRMAQGDCGPKSDSSIR